MTPLTRTCAMYIKESQKGEGTSGCMCVRREREMQVMVTVCRGERNTSACSEDT